MPFKVDDRVVYPPFGIGRVVALVEKSFYEGESHLCYEVIGERSTVWVQVDEGQARGLRRLTRRDEMDHYRLVVGSRPASLNQDPRERQLDLQGQLKTGSMQGLCEMVRDLSARGWTRRLLETDALALRRSRTAVCQEWAVVEGVPLPQATAELNDLLHECRQKYGV